MENIFYQIEFWNLCLAILALVISVCTYFKHDKTLKEQESQINEYHLKQLEKEVGMEVCRSLERPTESVTLNKVLRENRVDRAYVEF